MPVAPSPPKMSPVFAQGGDGGQWLAESLPCGDFFSQTIPGESRLRALVWNRLLKGEPDYLCLTYRKKIFHQSAAVLRDFEVQTEQTSNQVLRM